MRNLIIRDVPQSNTATMFVNKPVLFLFGFPTPCVNMNRKQIYFALHYNHDMECPLAFMNENYDSLLS